MTAIVLLLAMGLAQVALCRMVYRIGYLAGRQKAAAYWERLYFSEGQDFNQSARATTVMVLPLAYEDDLPLEYYRAGLYRN